MHILIDATIPMQCTHKDCALDEMTTLLLKIAMRMAQDNKRHPKQIETEFETNNHGTAYVNIQFID